MKFCSFVALHAGDPSVEDLHQCNSIRNSSSITHFLKILFSLTFPILSSVLILEQLCEQFSVSITHTSAWWPAHLMSLSHRAPLCSPIEVYSTNSPNSQTEIFIIVCVIKNNNKPFAESDFENNFPK